MESEPNITRMSYLKDYHSFFGEIWLELHSLPGLCLKDNNKLRMVDLIATW
jgi:hypothetical protein